MRRYILLAMISVATLWGGSCGHLLTISDQKFKQVLKTHTSQMRSGVIKPTTKNIKSKQSSIVLNRCTDLRVLKHSKPSDLSRRTILLKLYGKKGSKEEKKIVKSAIEESKKFYSAISRESFMPQYKGTLVFLGVDFNDKEEFFIEEVRKNGRKLRKKHIVLSRDKFASKICSLSKARRVYVSQIIKLPINCLSDLPKSVDQNQSQRETNTTTQGERP